MSLFCDVKMFLLDMDGTFYLGDELLVGAKEFLSVCKEKNIRYMFLTNNSSKSAKEYIKKLSKWDIFPNEEDMFTSGDASLMYMQENFCEKEILVIGTESLHEQFQKEGYVTDAKNPKAVVLGFDTDINYQKLTRLCDAVRSGVPYIATHPDFNCPVPGGMIPDIGGIIALVNACAGRMPDTIVGKPNAYIAKAAAKKAGLSVKDLCMVGDRLYTDIALGKAGVQTALVLSGETKQSDLEKSDITPNSVHENLAEMAQILQSET